MKTMKCILFFVIAAISIATSNAQVGAWRTHFVYNTVTDVVQTPNKVFALANGSLFSVDKRDKTVEVYSKMSGLNDTDVSTIAYNEQAKTLVVAYANSNIDLITDDGIFNLSRLSTMSITFSKRINSIYMNGNFAYLACDAGIVPLNLAKDKREFVGETYLANLPISSITMSDTHIYAASGTDIYMALKNDKNLINRARWEIMENLPGAGETPQTSYLDHKSITYFSGRLYALKFCRHNTNGTLLAYGRVFYKEDGKDWNPTTLRNTSTYSLQVQGSKLLLSNANTILPYNSNNVAETNIASTNNTTTNYIQGIVLSKEGEYWLAGRGAGLINLTKNEVYTISGPASKDARDIYTFGDKIFVNTSAKFDTPALDAGSVNPPAAIMIYSTQDKTWSNITNADIPANVTGNARRSRFTSLTSLAADPNDNTHFFASTVFGGVYEFREGKFCKRHDTTNSTIKSYGGGTSDDYVLTWGLSYDKDGKDLLVWNACQPNNPIKILKNADGTAPCDEENTLAKSRWTELDYPQLSNLDRAELYIDSHNNKWVSRNVNVGGNIATFIFNENIPGGTKEFNAGSNKFIDQDDVDFFSPAQCFVEDKTGKLWIGTNSGPIIIEEPENIFSSNRCTRIKVPRNNGTNIVDYLLNDIQVNAIAVDGDDRKWIGTLGYGIYLVSKDGTEVLQHFTADNSPLLSDDINSLTLSETGELFVATDLGVCSYQTDAVEANMTENPFENVYAFPNPVTENYNGVISIVGLQTDTNIKITDINGTNIYETTSRGGMATWDGRNKNGQKASSGIYLVLCALDDASETVVTKIMIINR